MFSTTASLGGMGSVNTYEADRQDWFRAECVSASERTKVLPRLPLRPRESYDLWAS